MLLDRRGERHDLTTRAVTTDVPAVRLVADVTGALLEHRPADLVAALG